ncbi:hypothetical protein BJX76DRAFT_354664 [Aspergillus varians]
MRIQKLLAAMSSLILVGNLALTADIDQEDVPNPCLPACQPVVSIARQCDMDNHDDVAEMDCICNSDQANTRVPLCEACIAQYRSDHPGDSNYGDNNTSSNGPINPHDNDAHDILSSCGFDTTTYVPGPSSSNSTSTPGSHSPRPPTSSPSHPPPSGSPSPPPSPSSSPSPSPTP